MLTIRVMRDGAGYAKKYLEQPDYYADGEKRVTGYWFGIGAKKLGLEGAVQHEHFERMRVGLHPLTGAKLRQRRSLIKGLAKDNRSRSLYDATVSAPKSVSLMATLGGDERVLEVHRRAVEFTMQEMERCAAVRVRANDQNTDRLTRNLIVARYTHLDSRRLDPQVHTHCVAANMTWDEQERKWKALQAGGIYARSKYLTEVYRNELARGLAVYGYEMEQGKHGPEIKGVPQPLIDKFSRGSMAKEAAIQEWKEKYKSKDREPTKNEVTALLDRRRPDKMVHISTEEVREQQSARLTPDDKQNFVDVRARADRNLVTTRTHSAEESLNHALDHVFERVSVARDYHVLTEALKHGRGEVNLDDLKRTMVFMEAHGQIIRAGDEIATRASLERERDMIALVNEGVAKYEPLGKDTKNFQVSKELSVEQRDVVEFVLASRDFAVNIDGAAGTGKTTALNELRLGLQAGGRLMVAVAPTMSAAEKLQETGFQNATTIESLLLNKDKYPELAGRAIILDEAGMVSGRQMHELLQLAKRFDARVIFSGDTQQLQSVEASDALRILKKESLLSKAAVELREVHRQESREYKAAIETLRTSPAKGLDRLDRMGAVKEVGVLDRAEAVAEAYRNAKGTALVVCPTHEEIGRVTEAIREDKHARGTLGAECKLHRFEPQNWTDAQRQDMRNFTPGLVLVFHQGTKDAFKYESFTVTAQKDDHLTARNESGREIQLTKKQAGCFGVFEKRDIKVAEGDWLSIQANVRDSAYQFTNGDRVKVAKVNELGGIHLEDGRTLPHGFRQFTHGYAITAHRSQGKTVDEVIISGDRFNQEIFYVAASRGRKKITIFTGDKENLRESISVSGERTSALEFVRKNALTVDRTRTAERPRTLGEWIGHLMEKIYFNIPRVVLGERFAPAPQREEMGQ